MHKFFKIPLIGILVFQIGKLVLVCSAYSHFVVMCTRITSGKKDAMHLLPLVALIVNFC